MTAAWELDLTSTHKLVFLALADNANEDGNCWPSIATIARKSCLTQRCVQKAIREMVKAGIISIREKSGHSNSYKLTPERGSPLPPKDVHPTPERGTGDPRTRFTQNHHEPSENLKKPSKAVDKREEGKKLVPRIIAAISSPDLRKSLPPEAHAAVRMVGDWYALGMKPRDLRGQTEQQLLNVLADM